MKLSLPPFLALIAASLPFAAQASTFLNLDATSSTGRTLMLAAGSYQVNIVGTSTAGALYNGWDVATPNYGCPNAAPAPGEWAERFGITFGNSGLVYGRCRYGAELFRQRCVGPGAEQRPLAPTREALLTTRKVRSTPLSSP